MGQGGVKSLDAMRHISHPLRRTQVRAQPREIEMKPTRTTSTVSPAIRASARRSPCPNRIALLVLASLLACLASCTQNKRDQALFDSGLPGMQTPVTVLGTHQYAGYLEADLSMGRHTIQSYSAPTPACLEVFRVGEKLDYIDNGPFGVYQRADVRCQSLGVGNLVVWRDRSKRSTGKGESIVPRAQANFRIIGTYPEVIVLEGDFPLANRLGFTAPRDVIAVVPNDELCVAATRTGTTSMEYRGKGPRALTLNAPNGLCDIRGLSMPLYQDTTPNVEAEAATDE